jgi:polyisoprenyl-teichoic acid--peptidoglycan teichoic acid transferase
MIHRKKTPPPAKSAETPQNLLDLNRSLPGYAYHPHQTLMPQTRKPAPPPKEPRKRWKRIVLWTITIVVTVFLLTGGWVAWKFLSNQIRIFGWSGLIGLFRSEKLQGEDTGHVNILLAGNSSDDAGHSGATLTDSIMVLSLNTDNHTAFMLSVPRDLYIDIPGYDYAKINEAYQLGEAERFSESDYPLGGMGLLQKTVSEHFNITLHYFALVDYAAVREAVDAVGGIDVTIDSDDSRGLYDPSPDLANNRKPLVKLSNGTHHLNGPEALGLARARGNHYLAYGYGLSDFQRAANQRQIMLGLKDRVVSLGTLSNPIKLGELFDSVGNNVETDLTLGNARRLYSLLKEIPNSSIVSASLNEANGENLLQSYRTPLGQSALAPAAGLDDYSEIQEYVNQLLDPPPPTQAKVEEKG